MITRDVAAFVAHARTLAHDFGPPTARGAFLVAPDGFRLAHESATDNRYMADDARFDATRASEEHRALHRALARRRLDERGRRAHIDHGHASSLR